MTHQDTTRDKPAHEPGVPKGEERARPLAQRATRKAADATGINLDNRGPIDPRMPSLPPA